MATATEYRFRLPLTTPDALRQFLHVAFAVRFPDTPACPGHTSPWRVLTEAYFAVHPVILWIASRASGKTFGVAHLGAAEVATLCGVTILGGSGTQSRRVHEHMIAAWACPSAPAQLLASDPSKQETTVRCSCVGSPHPLGHKVRALLASSRDTRGLHEPRLRIDEADEAEWEIVSAALGQPRAEPGAPAQTLITSTYHRAGGTVSRLLELAEERGWPVYRTCWKDVLAPAGWLDPAEVERKRREVTSGAFAVEWDLADPGAYRESSAFHPDALARLFDPALGALEGRNGEYGEFEPPESGAAYATGMDLGLAVHWTPIVTLRYDVQPARVVAFERFRQLPSPEIERRFTARLARYPGAAAYDATGMDVVGGYLQGRAEGVKLVGLTRSDLFAQYLAAVERGELVSPLVEAMRREHAGCRIEDLHGAGHPPDTVVAMALAYRAALRGPAVMPAAEPDEAEQAALAALVRQWGGPHPSDDLPPVGSWP